MLVSLKWIRDYVDINVPADELASRLTLAGLAVDAVENRGENISNVITGKILNIEPHPNADRLVICEIDAGQAENLRIVTGATNVRVGQVVPVALEGAHLAGGIVIKKAKLRGVESRGMLCSGQELGLDTSIMPPEQAHGIMILEPDLPVGLDVKGVIGLDDVVFDLDIPPNRGDCMSIVGVAREIAAILGEELRLPDVTVEETLPADEGMVRIDIDDPDLCGRYVARVFKNVKVGPSPRWMQERLQAVGIRPISNIVDITNYVMMEMGQPLHSFDLDRLKDGHIIVRKSFSGEIITSLDGNERKLTEEMLVIADPGGAVAVAGVMGGLASEVTDQTSSILLEAAYFDPINIRKTSRALALRSEASSRFERGIDITGCRRAADRAARLLIDLKCGEVVQGIWDVYPGKSELRTVMLRPDRAVQVLGVDISRQDIINMLTGLEFSVRENGDQFLVTVPGHRVDISIEEDLIEEIARMYGYNKVPYTLPYGASTRGARTTGQALMVKIKDFLAGIGLNEVVTYSFTSPSVMNRAAVPQDSPLRNMIHLQNPMSEEQSVMRTTILPSLLEVLQWNASRRITDLAVFEAGRVFLPTKPGQLPDEKTYLAAAAMGSSASGWNKPGTAYDFYYFKGALEALFNRIGFSGYKIEKEDSHHLLHPGRAARIVSSGRLIGIFGELHPDVMENFDLPKTAVVLEIDCEELFCMARRPAKYRALPKFPAIERDLAVVVRQEVTAQEVIRVIKKFAGRFLQDIRLFDVYTGGQIKEGCKSMAFSLKFQAKDRTLTDQEVSTSLKAVAEALVKKLGVEMRG